MVMMAHLQRDIKRIKTMMTCVNDCCFCTSSLMRMMMMVLLMMTSTAISIESSLSTDHDDSTISSTTNSTTGTLDGNTQSKQHYMKSQRKVEMRTLQSNTTTTTNCVTDEAGLRDAIDNAPDSPIFPFDIDLCTRYMTIDNSVVNPTTGFRGIPIIFRNINLNCIYDTCIIDAQKLGRHFYIKFSTLKLNKILFLNGKGTADTRFDCGSICIQSSIVKLNSCDFINNVSPEPGYGGSIVIKDSTIQMNSANMINNLAGNGGAMFTFDSIIQMNNVTFQNNTASEYGGAINSFFSNITMENAMLTRNSAGNGTFAVEATNMNFNNVNFSKSINTKDDVCDVLVAIFDDGDPLLRNSRVNMMPPSSSQKKNQQQRTLYAATSTQQQQVSRLLQVDSCVNNCTALIAEVNNCTRKSNKQPCLVTVCTKNIECSRTNLIRVNATEPGINVSNKDIIFDCKLEDPTERCILDGNGIGRLFFGSNTNITFDKFIFANGYDAKVGGAMKIQVDSIVTLSDCTFENCTAPLGSALSFRDSQLIMEGAMSTVVNNNGDRASLEFFSSQVTIRDTHFEGNDISFYGAEILMFDTTINIVNVTSDMNKRAKQDECKILVTSYINDIKRKFSCMGMGVIPLPKNTTTPTQPTPTQPSPSSPTQPSPSSPPQPTICLSSENKVNVKGVGHLHINEIKIGDFVESGNRQFTQVYGFGHLDHIMEATFLQVHYTSTSNNKTDSGSMFSSIEISPMHLVYVARSNHQYPIRASDIVIGDKLNDMIVTKLETVIRHGLYAPLTYSGDLMVNEVLVSNYVDILDYDWTLWNQHILGHALFFPQRRFCSCFMEAWKQEGYINGYGYLSYVIVSGSSFLVQLKGTFVAVNMMMVLVIIIGFLIVGCCLQTIVCGGGLFHFKKETLKRNYYKN